MKTLLFFILLLSCYSLKAQDGAGSAIIDFNGVSGKKIEVVCGSIGTWTITYTVPDRGMPVNGGIRIFREPNKYWLGQTKQITNPQSFDYFTMKRSDGGNLDLVYLAKSYKDHAEAQVKVKGKPMPGGAKIILTFGDRSQGGLGAVVPLTWQSPCIFHVESDLNGDGKGLAIKEPLVIVPVAGKVAKLVVQVPSIIQAGQKAILHVRAEDKGSNFIDNYSGIVKLKSSDNKASLSDTLKLTNGVASKEFVFNTPGIHYIDAELQSEKAVGSSNPAKVVVGKITTNLYCGDIHIHTEVSDGTGSLNSNYQYARDVSWLDFIAITDHLGWDSIKRPMVMTDSPTRLSLPDWNKIQGDKAREYYQPGKFVTFLAYEWSGLSKSGGDHNVYYMDDKTTVTCQSALKDQYSDLRGIKNQNAFVIPHVGGRIADPAWHDSLVEPCVEINSMHDHFEWFAQQYLLKGFKVGFVGSGDGHFGLPGNDIWANHGRLGLPRRDLSIPQGTVMAYSADLSRNGIRNALFSRHTYATTNVRILLDVTVDKHMMGDAYTSSRKPQIHISVAGTANISRIEIIRNQDRIFNKTIDAKTAELDFTDQEPYSGHNYYYVRVSQSDGEIAWSSPVFLQYMGVKPISRTACVSWNYELSDDEPGEPVTRSYLSDLTKHINIVAPGRFSDLKQVREVHSSRGDYALFYGYDKKNNNTKIHIRWYLGFDAPRMHSSLGWRDFGSVAESAGNVSNYEVK
jgi:hypothetical protein